jgi:hypothetical protein
LIQLLTINTRARPKNVVKSAKVMTPPPLKILSTRRMEKNLAWWLLRKIRRRLLRNPLPFPRARLWRRAQRLRRRRPPW